MTRTGQFAAAASFAFACMLASASSAPAGDEPCFFKGTMYSEGAASCQGNMQYKCDDGEWKSAKAPCQSSPIAASRPCSFDGISYTTGSASCQSGTQYRCEDGTWRSIARPCTVLGANTVKIQPGGTTCMYEGATVATGSTICKSESTFLCNNGEWVNLGTLCR
jgi:hypothetical protein